MNTPGTPIPTPPPPAAQPGSLRRQIMLDNAIRAVALLALVAALALGSAWDGVSSNLMTIITVLVAAGWLAMSTISAKAWRQIPHITQLLDQDPAAAQEEIAAALRRFPLQRSVRLLLFHRLAVLCYRQRRFAETAAICQAVLTHRLGSARAVRGHLLLMLAEARLETGDMHGAYAALLELHRGRLSLAESLQRLALQTRYEVACGYHMSALENLPRKVQLIELMPGPQCGLMHDLLAIAATHARQDTLAAWLRSRAELLCTPEQRAAALQ